LGTSRADGTRAGTKRYTHEMLGEDDHRALAVALQQCTAVVVVSGYPSELYAELYAGWDRVEFATGTSAGGEWSTRTEVVWSNRPLGAQPALWDAS
jgi:DNA adenine methylase